MRAFVLIGCAAALTGCGYIGDPLPPALNIPERIKNLRVMQRGERLLIDFTIPELTTEAIALTRVSKVELRARTGDMEQPFLIDATKQGPVSHAIPIREWIGKEVVFDVRTAGPKDKLSQWSNTVAIAVVDAPSKPAELHAEAVPAGVRVTWSGPGTTYRLYRLAGKQQEPVLIATVKANEFVDSTTGYGEQYAYSVEAMQREAMSEFAGPVVITPEDKFAPAAPAGLTAIAGVNTIELAWERNTEPDLKNYRVYRASEGAGFQPITDVDVPAYSDRQIETGKKYRYAVTATDSRGNEGSRSAPVEVVGP